MKKLIISSLLALTIVSGYSQTNSSGGLFSGISNFLTGSNVVIAPYAIYDLKTHSTGAGIGLIKPTFTDYTAVSLRLDYINKQIYRPSGSFQLQVPLHLFNNKVTVYPFAFAGIAVPFGGGASSSTTPVTEIFGTGGAIQVKNSWFIVADYERWGPDNQIRAGIAYKF